MHRKVIGIAIIIFGLCIACFPFLLSNCNKQEFNAVISNYDNVISEKSDEEKQEDMLLAGEYNKLISSGTIDSNDDTYDSDTTNYYSLLAYGDGGEIGYISIPKVGINLPIYHGTSDAVLSKGAGHMVNTSLPIGGASTHSVIVGHTGLSYAMFDGLHELVVGDKFYITIQDKTLTYQVVETLKVLPNETDYTVIVPGKDLVTLVTCFPFATGGNSHRLLVCGERIKY